MDIPTPNKMVCIFAHPDDEAFGPGGSIAMFTKICPVYIVCVTDGDGDHNERLGEIRKKETIESGKVLGIKDIYFLGFHDGDLSNNLYHAVVDKIQEKLDTLSPDTIMTYDIGGVSGHLDHIAVAMMTSYIFEKTDYIRSLLYFCEGEYMKDILKDYFVYVPPGYTKKRHRSDCQCLERPRHQSACDAQTCFPATRLRYDPRPEERIPTRRIFPSHKEVKMAGIVALYGSGEFTPAMSDVDLYVLGETPAPNVAILPTAAGMEDDYRHWLTDGIAHFQRLGIEVAGIDVRTRDDADDKKLLRMIDDYTCFVFSGGDPGYLLETLQGSLLWKKILSLHKQGATIIGSSAGAMVLGPRVWSSVYKFDTDRTLEPWVPGLGLINFGVLPHFDFIEREFDEEDRRAAYDNIPSGTRVVGIDENTAYIKVKGEWIKKGKGKVHDPIKTK